jgi:HEAT repeat protein
MTTKKKAAKASKSARKPKLGAVRSTKAALSIATSARGAVKERVAALSEVPLAVCESDKNLQAVLNVLRNKDEPVEVRMAAMDTLATAAFSVIAFEPCRPDYVATLREVAQDPNADIRQSALGLLAGLKDGFAQKKLLDGLKNPEKALVPPEKALQLLSYDVHAEAYSVARDIVSNPPSEDARREALRLLAADATSAPLFEKLLRDKDELREVRQISASALHALKPERLQEHAREMLLDKSEYEDIQATSLTALTQFGDDTAMRDDKALMKSVDRLSNEAKSSRYKQSARRFISKYEK